MSFSHGEKREVVIEVPSGSWANDWPSTLTISCEDGNSTDRLSVPEDTFWSLIRVIERHLEGSAYASILKLMEQND